MNKGHVLGLLVLLMTGCVPSASPTPLVPSVQPPTASATVSPPTRTPPPSASPTPDFPAVEVLSVTHIAVDTLEVRLAGFPPDFDDMQYTYWIDDLAFDCAVLPALDALMVCYGPDLPPGSPGRMQFRGVETDGILLDLSLDLAGAGLRIASTPEMAQASCAPPQVDEACLDSTWMLHGQAAWILFCQLHPSAPFCYQPYDETIGLRCGFCTVTNACGERQTFDWLCMADH